METHETYVSVLDPLGPAIEHTKSILFRPFDFDRWLAIGFCAWLATFGESSGSGGLRGYHEGEHEKVIDSLHHAKDYILANLHWLIPVVVVGLIIVVGLWFLFLWLSSRGRFMFLNCVLYNTADVARPWHYYKHLAHSLLRFRVALWLIGMSVIIGLGLFGAAVIFPLWRMSGAFASLSLICFIPLILLASFSLLVIEVFTVDFVVPLMLKYTLTCTGAWLQLRNLMAVNKGRCLLYLFFKLLMNIVIHTLLILIIIATCCTAGCLMAIPYIGTVLLLPIIVFKRAYSLHYLRQFGPYFDLLASTQPEEPVPSVNDDQLKLF